MMNINEDPLYLEISDIVNGFHKRYLERVEKVQQKVKACKKNTVLQSKIAQEEKLNADLKAQLCELSKRGDDLDRICVKFASGVTISDSDQHRLENAKELVEIGKKLTGVRFDYSAPPNIIKGYVKNECNRTLSPFSVTPDDAEVQLWRVVEDSTIASVLDKENRRDN